VENRKIGRFIIIYSKFEFWMKNWLKIRKPSGFFRKPSSFRFFHQISKIKILTKIDQFFPILKKPVGTFFSFHPQPQAPPQSHNHPAATQDKIERGTIWVLEQSVFLDRFIPHGAAPITGGSAQAQAISISLLDFAVPVQLSMAPQVLPDLFLVNFSCVSMRLPAALTCFCAVGSWEYQVWMVGENGEDLHGTKELLPLSKLQGAFFHPICSCPWWFINDCFISWPLVTAPSYKDDLVVKHAI
jgi:hypothetical protein